MGIDSVLTICAVCKKIRLGDKSYFWLNREENPHLYDQLLERYKGRLSHGYCPEDAEKAEREIDKFFTKL